MSALEQIRKRPGLIISILGLALVLFIFTAISNPEQLFSDPSTIAKVNGKKIDHAEFSQLSENLRRQYEQQGYKNVDNAIIQERAMEELIQQELMKEEMERLGITVTGEELGQAMLGENVPMAIQQLYWQRQQMGIPTGRELHDLITNPQQYQLDGETLAQLRNEWIGLENQVKEMLMQQKFSNLVIGTLQANDLDVKAQYEDNNVSRTMAYAKVDASTVPDSEVEVSESDLKAVYDSEKGLHPLDEDTYVLSYITVDVNPSDEDRLEATRAIEDALMGLRNQPGTDAVSSNNKFVINRYNTSLANLPASIKDKIETLKQDTVMQISFYDNKYTLAKFLGQGTAVDSITYDVIAIAETADPDSILNLLNNGTPLADLAEGTVAQSQLGQKASLLSEDSQVGLVFGEANEGEYFSAADYTGTPNVLFRLASKKAPVTTYNVAEITYQLDASPATINDIQSKLRAYVANNNTAKAFAENATAAGYTAIPVTVTASSMSVNGIPDTRSLAKWATKADKGEVSDVISDDNKSIFIAAALTDSYDKGFVPMRDPQVMAQVRAKAMRDKKLATLMERFQGKGNSLESYAQAMNAKVDTTTVTFGQNYVRGFMPGDGKLIAIASEAKEGELQGPAATDYSVVVLQVVGEEKSGRELDPVNDATYFQQSLGQQPLLRAWPQIMRANADVDNRIQKFFAD